MNVSQVLPKEQKAIIRKALNMLDEALTGFDQECDVVQYQRHDIMGLLAFLDYDVSVTMSKARKDKFAFIHKVDFPEYNSVDAKYPIESGDEYTTVIFGNFNYDLENKRVEVVGVNTIENILNTELDEKCEAGLEFAEAYLIPSEFDGVVVMNDFNGEVIINNFNENFEVEVKDEWVTVMVGDYELFDDKVHEREARFKSIVAIEKHLRSQVDAVIHGFDNDGYGCLIVDDYDGAIITNYKEEPVKDEREFQVTWLASHYDAKTEVVGIESFGDDNGYEDIDRKNIEQLIESQSYETAEGGVVIVRLQQN